MKRFDLKNLSHSYIYSSLKRDWFAQMGQTNQVKGEIKCEGVYPLSVLASLLTASD